MLQGSVLQSEHASGLLLTKLSKLLSMPDQRAYFLLTHDRIANFSLSWNKNGSLFFLQYSNTDGEQAGAELCQAQTS